MSPVDSPESGAENVVELVPPPASRVWVASWLAFGAALFLGACLLASAEVLLSLKSPLLEAVASPRSP